MLRSKSIYSFIRELNEPEWNYYAVENNNQTLHKPFVTKKAAVDFIDAYFAKGGKKLITERFGVENFGVPRAEHTVSIFFLGVLLYHHTIFRDKVFYDGRVNTRFDFFAFIWFITCLAHDFAFYRERDPQLCASIPDVDTLLIQENITHNILTQTVRNVPQDMFQLVRQYYNLRHADKRTDHGILAGILLYDILVENRQYQYGRRNSDLLWEKYLETEYAYAAATIAIHNMWLPGDPDFSKYEKHGLHNLIGRKKFTFNEGPLFYLLGIVDTLDPVKAFRRKDKDEPTPAIFILRNVKLKFLSSTSFELTVTRKLDPTILHEEGAKAGQWLAIAVSPIKRGIRVEVDF